MLRIALIGVLLQACAAPVAVGAATMTAAAVGSAGVQRRAGGCYAMCVQGTTCNPGTGLCERLPCDGACRADQHCETTFNKSECVAGAPYDVASKAPGTDKTIPVMLPQSPGVESGPPEVVPAAMKDPPSHK